MTNTATPIRTKTLSQQAAVAKRLVSVGESMTALARTPEQVKRMEDRLARMRKTRDSLVDRATRLEGYCE